MSRRDKKRLWPLVVAACWSCLAVAVGASRAPASSMSGEPEADATAPAEPTVAPTAAIGIRGTVGCQPDAKRVSRLIIDQPGVYENLLVDGQGQNANLVKITGNNVTLKNCEIRFGRHNGVYVSGSNVTIDSCKIHHLLKGTYAKQDDAHGICGKPQGLVIRNCEIFLVSGDSTQFDPDRKGFNDVLIEQCSFWTGPLDRDLYGFKRGERPGENALDTKNLLNRIRARITIRDCAFWGWGQGQIGNQAALNLKENVDVRVTDCLFRDNDICFRVRGGRGDRGGAYVTADRCALYRSKIGLRIEDGIEWLQVRRLAVAQDLEKLRLDTQPAKAGVAIDVGPPPPPFEELLKSGFLEQAAAN